MVAFVSVRWSLLVIRKYQSVYSSCWTQLAGLAVPTPSTHAGPPPLCHFCPNSLQRQTCIFINNKVFVTKKKQKKNIYHKKLPNQTSKVHSFEVLCRNLIDFPFCVVLIYVLVTGTGRSSSSAIYMLLVKWWIYSWNLKKSRGLATWDCRDERRPWVGRRRLQALCVWRWLLPRDDAAWDMTMEIEQELAFK